jgi:hypothetical protein
LEAFIRWMYLGKIVKPALAENLFLLGDRYMVEELKVCLFLSVILEPFFRMTALAISLKI